MNRTLAKPEDEFTALEICIGANDTQTYSIDLTKLLIKTTQNEIDELLIQWGGIYTWEQILEYTFCTELTYEQSETLMLTIEWQNNNILI